MPHTGPLMVELENAVVEALKAHPTGIFRTEAQVAEAVRAALREAVQRLKDQTRYLP